MKYFLIILLVVLLGLANCILGQGDTLMKEYIRLDSIIEADKESNPLNCIIAAKKQYDVATMMKNDSLMYLSSINKASLLNEVSMFDQSLVILYDLLSKSDKKKYDPRISKLYYYLGSSYFQMNDFSRAKEFFQKSKSAALKYKKYSDTIEINSEIGLCLVGEGQLESGFEILIQNLKSAQKTGNEEIICTTLDNLSNAYYEVGDYENSLKYQEQILLYPKIVNESLHNKAAIHQHLATINIKLKRWSVAQKYTDLANQYALALGSNYWLFDVYKDQAEIYEATGQYRKALSFFQQYTVLKDSVYKHDYDTKMSTVANLYELENKEYQIVKLTSAQNLANVKIQRLYLFLVVLALLFGLIGIYYLYRKSRAQKDLQQKIAFQLLHAQEEERQRIAKELHDSVGQNILFIKNQIISDTSGADLSKLKKSADDALAELRNISKNLYPNQLEKYGLIAAVETLAEEINSHSGIFVSSDMEGIDAILNKNVKINFYRIIQEFVNNTIKHADATAIRITAQQINDTIELIVQDNGKGFDKSEMERNAHKSFGLLNMEERIRMLKGKCTIETAPGKGTKSIFTIPI